MKNASYNPIGKKSKALAEFTRNSDVDGNINIRKHIYNEDIHENWLLSVLNSESIRN